MRPSSVKKDSHKGIITETGKYVKKIGSNARYEIERLLDAKVNLQLWVKVKKDWRDSDFLINEILATAKTKCKKNVNW